MIKENIFFYESSGNFPLIEAIKSQNEKLIQVFLDFLSTPQNIKFLKSQDIEYLLNQDTQQIDTFLSKLPQQMFTFYGDAEYIPKITPIEDNKIIYKHYGNIYKHEYDKIIDNTTNIPLNKIERIEKDVEAKKGFNNKVSNITIDTDFMKIKEKDFNENKNFEKIDLIENENKIVDIKDKDNDFNENKNIEKETKILI